MKAYLAAVRHPWACLVFVLPLIGLYEAGVVYLGGSDPNALRNGADVWLRWGVARYGVSHPYALPIVVLAILLFRTARSWSDRPKDMVGVLFGMVIESLVFAAGLWAAARNLDPILKSWGVSASVAFQTPAAGQLVTYVGAGIYEEVLFRLGLFSALCVLLRAALLPGPVAILVAAAAGALLFAAAHHVGPTGEPMVPVRFLFRVLAGLYFTALYVGRGFGVAVGAHAGYDILVGVAVG